MPRRRNRAVAVRFTQPLQLETARPLAIVIDAPPQPPRKWWLRVRAGLIVFFMFVLMFGARFVVPEQTLAPYAVVPGVEIGYVAPASVAVGDEAVIEVSVRNTADKPLSLTLLLDFPDPAPAVATSVGETTTAALENLPPGALATRALRFVLPTRPAASSFAFGVRAQLNGEQVVATPRRTMGVTPWIPRVRSVLLWLLGSSGLAALFLERFWKLFS